MKNDMHSPGTVAASALAAAAAASTANETKEQVRQVTRLAEEQATRQASLLLLSQVDQLHEVADAACHYGLQHKGDEVFVCVGDGYLATLLNRKYQTGEFPCPRPLRAFGPLADALRAAAAENHGDNHKIVIYHHSLQPVRISDPVQFANCRNFVLVADADSTSSRLVLEGPVAFENSRGVLHSVALHSDKVELDKDSDVAFVNCHNLFLDEKKPAKQQQHSPLENTKLHGFYEEQRLDTAPFAEGLYMVHFGHFKNDGHFVLLEPCSPETCNNCFVLRARALSNGAVYRTWHGPAQRQAAAAGADAGFLSAVVLEPALPGTMLFGWITHKIQTNVSLTEATLVALGEKLAATRSSSYQTACVAYETLRPRTAPLFRPEVRLPPRALEHVMGCFEGKKPQQLTISTAIDNNHDHADDNNRADNREQDAVKKLVLVEEKAGQEAVGEQRPSSQ